MSAVNNCDGLFQLTPQGDFNIMPKQHKLNLHQLKKWRFNNESFQNGSDQDFFKYFQFFHYFNIL